MKIEAEIKSFISKEKYEELLEFFKKNSKFIKEDHQETIYFDDKQDLRIQNNDFYSKITLKKGKMHDYLREEIEIKFNKNDFEKLEGLFLSLGYNIKIKWFRKRFVFEWEEINVALDYTKAYGYIIEVEKICNEEETQETLQMLKNKLDNLKVEISPIEEFNEKFEYYQKNWKELTKD